MREFPWKKPPLGPCPTYRGNHWNAQDPWFPGELRPEPPIQAPVTTIKAEELWEILPIEKHKVSLLIDTGASISAIPFSSGPRSSKNITV
jgi:hypothetical protein